MGSSARRPEPVEAPARARQFTLAFGRDGARADRLEVLAGGSSVDAAELGRWILMGRRWDLGRTPYRQVRARLSAPPEEEPEPVVDEALAPALRRALEAAVARSVGPSMRVGVLAGGGLDSAAVLAIAHRLLRARGGEAIAVAIDFRAEGDDRPYLRMLAADLGCRVVRIAPEDAPARRALLAGVDGAPFTIPLGFLEAEAMARVGELGGTRLLTGAGGDDLFDGHPTALADLTARGQVVTALRRARTLGGFAERPRPFAHAVRPALARRAPARVRLALARRARPGVPDWAGPTLREVVADGHRRRLEELAADLASGQAPARAPSPSDLVEHAWYRHQQEIAGGLSRWDPYLDPTLVRFVQALPPVALLEGNVRRGLFRAAIRDLVPEPLRLRLDKAAFEPAMFRWVESAGGFASFASLATAERLGAAGLVEPGAFRAAFATFARTSMIGYDWCTVWPALAVEAFLRAR